MHHKFSYLIYALLSTVRKKKKFRRLIVVPILAAARESIVYTQYVPGTYIM